jgi:imidazolonepropionase-like amidohydrolase
MMERSPRRSKLMPSDGPPQAPTADLPDPGIRTPDPAERRRPTLFRRANVVDVAAGTVRSGADVLVVDGRIERVGESIGPNGAHVVELAGRYLLPGLIGLHVHPGMMVGLRMDPNRQTPERMVHDLRVWLRHGVTTVQAMGSDRAFGFDLQQEQRSGAFLGARLFSVGHGFGVRGGVPPFQMDPPGPVRETEPEAIRRIVEDLARRGANGVKIWYDDWYGQMPKMTPDVARTIVEACRRLGLTSYAHVYRVDDAKLLIGFGLDVLAHMPRDREADRELVDLMLERGTAVIPTLAVPESNVAFVDRPTWVDDPLLGRFLPPGSREYLRDEAFLTSIRQKPEFPQLHPDLGRALRNVELLYRAGVRIGFGTDTGVSNRVIGFYEHRELELLVRAGVTPADALRMATLTSAEIVGQQGTLGEVAPGRRADLVVLRENPLENVRNTRTIESVWLDGVRACDAL